MQVQLDKQRCDVECSVICADVDGTVLATDLLYESLLFALKHSPFLVFVVPFWFMRGRAYLKARLAEVSAELEVGVMPLHEEVVTYLRHESAKGRRVVLASASHRSLVGKVADRLGFVSSIVASDVSTNCKGERKAQAIEEHLGGAAWEYLGDSGSDFKVWNHAARVVCVTSSDSFAAAVRKRYPDAQVIRRQRWSLKTISRALRVHQWLKNTLCLVPVLLAHRWFDRAAMLGAVGSIVAFSLCASGVYLLNDLLDLEADRKHPRKRRRPCASGELPIVLALGMAPVLFVAAFAVAGMVSAEFSGILALYLVLTTAYSFRLKALALVDIILLAILYTIRIVGGGVAAGVPVSQWLLGLSMFLFLSLACVKRFSELLVLQQRNENRTWGRGYSVGDLEQVASFGSASGYISVLVLALYVSSHEVVQLYSNPAVIWLACPLLLYWISRIWLLARRGLVHDDPLVFALRDKVTYVVGGLGFVIFIWAKFTISQ